jgi:hypothetical protein
MHSVRGVTSESTLHDEREHWEQIWQTKGTGEMSWFQASPEP